MTETVAFLRAINVAGHAVVRMSELELAFTRAGCNQVRSILQSGNVFFSSKDPDSLAPEILREVTICLGQSPVIVYRSLAALEKVVRDSPFGGSGEDKDTKYYVSFLSRSPKAKPRLPLVSPKEGLEIVASQKTDVFLVSRRIQGRFGFPNNFVEKEFGVPATTRNFSTVRRIVEKFAKACRLAPSPI